MLDRAECGKRLRAAREAAGWTQTGAAAALGVARPSYAQYELGRRVPSWTALVEMVERLGLDPGIMFPEFVGRGPKR